MELQGTYQHLHKKGQPILQCKKVRAQTLHSQAAEKPTT